MRESGMRGSDRVRSSTEGSSSSRRESDRLPDTRIASSSSAPSTASKVVSAPDVEERQEEACDLAKTVLALVGRQHPLADVLNVGGPAFCSSSLGRIRRLDLGRKRLQVVVLAAAPPHVGHSLDDERLHLLIREPVWRNLKKPPRKSAGTA